MAMIAPSQNTKSSARSRATSTPQSDPRAADHVAKYARRSPTRWLAAAPINVTVPQSTMNTAESGSIATL